MSVGRLTQRSIATHTLAGLQASLGRTADLQNKLSSGRAISKPSDSPTGTVAAMQMRSEISDNLQWSRNADDGLGWLGTIDQTLTTSMDSLARARDLTLTGLNDGAASSTSPQALAAEIDQIRQGMIGTANTRYLDRPVFGGTTGGQQAYDAAGNYLGPAVSPPINRTVGANAQVRVDQTGPEVFGPAGNDLFTVLGNISTALRAGNHAALQTGLGDLDAAVSRMSAKHAEVGAAYNRLQQMQSAAGDRVISLKSSLSDVENVDLPSTVVELSLAQVAQQAALAATQRVITPSLADFLR
jgi:flagellar hook-associated protein 3 FlgL